MADERKCFAGDLGTVQIGRVVEVQLMNGDRVSDKLKAVRHSAVGDGVPTTLVVFVNIPNPVGMFGAERAGWSLDPESEVTVRS